jgi:hypothetical protein
LWRRAMTDVPRSGRSIFNHRALSNILGFVAFIAGITLFAVFTWPAWEVVAIGVAGVGLFLVGRRRHLLHRFQTGLSDELQIGPPTDQVRRGEEIDVEVTVVDPRRLTNVEVGLVCTEYYDVEVTSTDSEGHTSSSRQTRDAIAHEAWIPVENAPGSQTVRLLIPPGAPFSYEGDCLSFRWELVARGHKRWRLDARAEHDLRVAP